MHDLYAIYLFRFNVKLYVLAFEIHVLTSLDELHQQQKIITASLQKIMRRLKQLSEEVELLSIMKLPISEMNETDAVEEALENKQMNNMQVSYICTKLINFDIC